MRWPSLTKRSKSSVEFCLLMLMILLTAKVTAQEPPPGAKLQLTKIEFEGLQAQNREKMIAAIGLQIGQAVDMDSIKVAAQRLSQTGLFNKVAYRYRFSSTIIELTFEVEEKTIGKRPCQFDNFIWFTDLELINAIKRDLPDFDGTMVVSDFVGEEVKKSLTRLLIEKKIAGEIRYEMDENLSYIFKVKDTNLKVCEAKFVGARVNVLEPLREAVHSLLKTEYSRSEVQLYTRAALIPVYRQRGFLKARFEQVQAGLSASGECANAVVITLPVEEGFQYRWDKAAWIGNQAFSMQQLDRGLKLKSGDVANDMMINAGWSEVSRIYGGRGYIKAQVKPKRSFDDARQMVSYQVEVSEGSQYRMGDLTVTGLSESDTKKVKDAWLLKAGEIFDMSYGGIFLGKIKREGLVKFRDVHQELKSDDEKLTANLTLKFE